MSAALLYLLQANLLLLCFAGGWLLLRRLTFFGLNRAYLLLALGWAALVPALPALPAWWEAEGAQAWGPALAGRWLIGPGAGTPAGAAALSLDWPTALLLLYAAGVLGLLGRLLLQGLALRRLHRGSCPAVRHGIAYREAASADVRPCSFWQTIYLSSRQLASAELAAVLRHEQAHVRQWHTLDVLLAQLLTALAWPNPAAWWLRRAVLANLEFLADRAALRGAAGAPERRAYQLSLLRLAQGGAAPPLTTSFIFPPLKTRILMLNQPPSVAGQAARYLLLAPLLAFTLSLSAVLAPAAQAQAGAEPVYYIDGQPATKAEAERLNATPKLIAEVSVYKDEDARKIFSEDRSVIIITTTQNQNSAAVRELNDKIARYRAAGPPPPPPTMLPAAITDYISKNYPGYRLNPLGSKQIATIDGKSSLSVIEIILGRRPKYLVFDEKGQFVREQ